MQRRWGEDGCSRDERKDLILPALGRNSAELHVRIAIASKAEPPFEKARSNNPDLTPIQARADLIPLSSCKTPSRALAIN